MDKVTAAICVIACFICAFIGYQYATMRAESEFYEYRLQAEQQYRQAVEARQETESFYIEQIRQLQLKSADLRREIEAKYQSLLQSVNRDNDSDGAGAAERVCDTKSAGDGDGLPAAARAADRTQSSQKNRQPRPSCRVYQNALSQAKKRILFEAKERDICAVHYNTLLKIYNSVR